MENIVFERKEKETLPVLAICYDFDKTLTPDDMQAQGYLQSIGYEKSDEFWTESNILARENDMDQNLAYMYKMVDESEGTLVFNKKALEEYGSKVKLFPGVEEWFQRIKDFAYDNGVIVEHYIISSGLKEMIEGTSVAKNGAFEKIYANSYFYNDRGVAKWPAQVVNFTNKTQFLFRIEKGVIDINDFGVNDYFEEDKIRVPFRNMIYIGDSDTDIPCMKLVNSYGGHSIGVYNSETQDKAKVYRMMTDKRIKYFAAADYTEGTELDSLIKSIIYRTAANEKLENIHYNCQNENIEDLKNSSEEEQAKRDLISDLDNSGNFARTHWLICQLRNYEKWTPKEKEQLFEIGVTNSQVFFILKDQDVRSFYLELLKNTKNRSENAEKIKNEINA